MKNSFRLLLVGALLLSVGLLESGCEMPKMPWDKKPPAAQTEEASAEEAATEAAETTDESATAEEERDMNKLIPEAMRDLPYSEVTIPMNDGLKIMGRLYDPAIIKDADGDTVTPADSEEDYTGPKYPLVILLHGLNLNQSHWQSLPHTLMKAGYAVFAMDLRGHGQSTRASRGRSLNWRALPDVQWPALYRDVGQVIDYFGKSEDYPEVNNSQVALIGEKLGANVAIWAAKQDDKVQALVLLTPAMLIKGLDAGKGVMDYPNSTLILVNQDERESYSAARYLYSWLGGPKVLQVYQKAGEGADMLTAQPAIAYQIRDWLDKALPPVRIPGAALTEKELKEAEAAGQQTQTSKQADKTQTPPHKG